MKAFWVLAAMLLLACDKEESVSPNEPVLPIARHLSVTISGADTSAFDVYVTRATQGTTLYHWKGGPEFFLALQAGGPTASVYRKDSIRFVPHGTCALTVRLDDVQTMEVAMDDGGPDHVLGLNW